VSDLTGEAPVEEDWPFVTLFCAHACGAILTVGGVTTLPAARDAAARLGWSSVFDETVLDMADLCRDHTPEEQ
jgi:hypothetical protein